MSKHKHAFTFKPVGSITDQPNVVRMCDCGIDLLDAYHTSQRQLAEAQAANQKEHIEFLDGARHQADVILELQAEIARMRPVFKAATHHRTLHTFTGLGGDTYNDCNCWVCVTIRDYEDKDKL
jgi:hypothetical protein